MQLRRRLRRGLVVAVGMGAIAFGVERAVGALWPYPVHQLQALPVSAVVEAADGTWLRVVPTPAGERVLPLRWREAPALLRATVLVAEDERFFAHSGVDGLALLRAVGSNLAAGRVVSGASTLTQQVVRIVEPRPRTLWSKCLEAVRARQLERVLGKTEIADVWLEQVPLGGTLRGFAAASHHWFGRPVDQLALAEIAALVAMVPAPSARSPLRHPEQLRRCRDELLRRLLAAGVVGEAAAREAQQAPLGMAPHPWPWHAPEAAAQRLAQQPGETPARCRTTIDLAVDRRLRRLLHEQPLPADSAAVVVLARGRGVPVALVTRQPEGGRLDPTCRERSLGSTLKPFLFALAREQGACAEHELLVDAPVAFGDWRPANFHRGHAGGIAARDALATSNNVAAVACLERVGPAAFQVLLQSLGLPASAAGDDLTAALGTGIASPLALAKAYQVFVDQPERVGLSVPSVAWTLTALRRLPLGPQGEAGAVAWKSGTSSGRRDAWCVGVTGRHVVVVWIGNRDGRGAADLVGARTATRLLAAVLHEL